MSSRNALLGALVLTVIGAFLALGRKPQDISLAPPPARPPAPALVTGPSEALAEQPAAALAPSPGNPCRVGFIDLETVYNSCRQAKAVDVEIAKLQEDGAKTLKPFLDDLSKLKERFDMLAPEAPEYAALREQIRAKQMEYRQAADPWNKDLNLRLLKSRERIYMRIREATAGVAKARGFDLVLADIETPHADHTWQSAEEIELAHRKYSAEIHRKAILFASKDADLTSAVLEAVNAAE